MRRRLRRMKRSRARQCA
ncbi:MAG: hypothetical protein ACKVY0_23915 [Prosthecobacter sp.]